MTDYDDYLDDARDHARLMSDDGPDDYEPGICMDCDGSGEGPVDGSTCGTCHGEGEI